MSGATLSASPSSSSPSKIQVRKRSGNVVDYQRQKIEQAIRLCLVNSCKRPDNDATRALAVKVVDRVEKLTRKITGPLDVEVIQDLTEQALYTVGESEAGRQYVLHREAHRQLREAANTPAEESAAVQAASDFFPTALSAFQHYNKYARYRVEDHRRETVVETVQRSMDFFQRHLAKHQMPALSEAECYTLSQAILHAEAAPSMRLLQMAGPAAERCNAHIYNCCYAAVSDIDYMAEILYLSMCGTGNGFSCEGQYVHQLPQIKFQRQGAKADRFDVPDTTEGWCDSVKQLAYRLFEGHDLDIRYDGIRPAGSRLKTKGGTACLTGDTVVYKDRKKSAGRNTITIAELYEKRLKTPRRLTHIQIRCLDEATGTFRRNKIVDVIDNGVAKVFEVITEAGYRIKATSNHRFMNTGRHWQHLQEFKVGDQIAVNGAALADSGVKRCLQCGCATNKHALRCPDCFAADPTCAVCHVPLLRQAHKCAVCRDRSECVDCGGIITNGHSRCRDCATKASLKPTALPTTARARKECQQANKGCCELCGLREAALTAAGHALQVHHVDRNPLNNADGNLMCLCEPCHHAVHAVEDSFGNPYRHRYLSFDQIVSIRCVGEERVYDLCMAEPNHNFIANGFVSHNSGPGCLQSLHNVMRRVIQAQAGLRLRDIDVHDIMCFIGKVGQLGNVRRGAEISLSDLDSKLMAEAKQNQFWLDPMMAQRTVANNSAVYQNKPTPEVFLAEWLQLVKSKAGERGIFNRGSIWTQIPERRRAMYQNRDERVSWGVNPCFAAGTLIHTRYGHFPIETLVGREAEVWDGDSWRKINNFRVTGVDQPLLKLTMTDGSVVRCTPYHKFILANGAKVQASELQAGNLLRASGAAIVHGRKNDKAAYLKGFLLGVGTLVNVQQPALRLYAPKASCKERLTASAVGSTEQCVRTNAIVGVGFITDAGNDRENMQGLAPRSADLRAWCGEYKQGLPAVAFNWTQTTKAEFLAGLFDADGTAMDTRNGFAYQLSAVSLQLLQDVQVMLKTMGIHSRIGLMKSAGVVNFKDGYGEYPTQDCWRLTLAQAAAIALAKQVRFSRLISFADRVCRYAGNVTGRRSRTVKSVIADGTAAKVYCCTVPDTHRLALSNGLLVGQCGEVLLYPTGQMCVSGDTRLITRDGVAVISEAVGTEVEIWNGEAWSAVVPVQTGRNQQLFRVHFSDGSHLDATGYHRLSVNNWDRRSRGRGFCSKTVLELMEQKPDYWSWAVEPFQIQYDDGEAVATDTAYDAGFAVGDGFERRSNARVCIDLFGAKDRHCPVRGNRQSEYLPAGYNVAKVRVQLPADVATALVMPLKESVDALDQLFSWSRKSILAFFAGWVDADGSETGTGGVRLYISGCDRTLRAQLLLTKCGIRSSACVVEEAGAVTNFGVRTKDMCYLQITDARELPTHRVDVSGGHASRFKSKYQTIRRIELLPGRHDVFCFEESQRHMGVFGNVLTYQCNLSQAIVRDDDTPASLHRKVEIAAIFGTLQATMTDFNYLRPVWKDNCERERLLGVDLGGAADCPLLRLDHPGQAALLTSLKNKTVVVNQQWAGRLGISPATAATVIKPGGNSGARWNVGQSMSGWLSQYMIRFVEVSNLDPMCRFLKDAGVYHEICYRDPQTTVFGFPLKAPEGAMIVGDLVIDAGGNVTETVPRRTALDQLENWLSFKQNFTEHNPSVTIYVDENEWLKVGSWVYDHWDDVGGLAFLPLTKHVYPQAPFTPVTEKAYDAFVARFPARIAWEKLSRYEDGRDYRDGEPACSSGQCELRR